MVVQVFPGQPAGSTTDDIVNGLVTGAFEMSEVGQANWGDYTTAFTPLNVPFLYPNEQTAYAIMSGEIGDGMPGAAAGRHRPAHRGLHAPGHAHPLQ